MSTAFVVWVLGAAVLLLTGCGQRASVKDRLSELEKAFPASSVSSNLPPENPGSDASAMVSAALAAARQNDYAAGIITLQTVQQVTRVTREQLRAVHETMQALTADLVERSAHGDAKAQADLAAIERTRSQ